MLLDGEAKLVDFGLAKMSEHSTMGSSVQGMRHVVPRGTYCLHTPYSLPRAPYTIVFQPQIITRHARQPQERTAG
jgi:hypothetical protein